MPLREGASWGLFVVHLLTASGTALALLAIVAVARGDWNVAFAWLGLALLIDGIDGPSARRYRLRQLFPQWDGAALDAVVHYTSYVFVPTVILARAIHLPPVAGVLAGMVIVVSGALSFADKRTTQPDNAFRGFPPSWNMVVFTLYVLMPPWPVTVGVVVLLAIATFLPLNFVHPLRVARWRALTCAVTACWFLVGAWLVSTDFEGPLALKTILVAASLYLLGVSAVQQYLRPRGASALST